MAKKIKYVILTISALLFFSGCTPSKNDLTSALQTNSANSIKNDYQKIQKHLKTFKIKLDKRNPSSYSKKYEKRIFTLINDLDKSFVLKYRNNILEDYKEYLQIAFSKDSIQVRNDYLVLGLYYLMYDSYDLESAHKITAFEYSKQKLHRMYKNLQILKWKIKVDKDSNGKYLFLTWQNNWQVELEKRLARGEKLSYSDLQKLKHIKEKKESVFDSSNFSFEVLLTQMIDRVKNSLEALGEQPKELSVSAIKSFFLFL